MLSRLFFAPRELTLGRFIETCSSQSYAPLIEWRRFAVRPLRPFLSKWTEAASQVAQFASLGHYATGTPEEPVSGAQGRAQGGDWDSALDNAHAMLATLLDRGWGLEEALALHLGTATYHVAFANYERCLNRNYLAALKGSSPEKPTPPHYCGLATKGGGAPLESSAGTILATYRALADIRAEKDGKTDG